MWSGLRAGLPLLLGVAPFGMIYGVLARAAGIPPLPAQAMSFIVLAGSSQFIATQLVSAAAPLALIVFTTFVVNLRHMLYSAALAPFLQPLTGWWKALLAYLLTDEAFALGVARYQRPDQSPYKHWYLLGAGLSVGVPWQIVTALGILLGAQVPAHWGLDFALPLTFLAIVMPMIKDRPALAAAVVAGVVAVLAASLPYKLGLMAAAAAGITTGLWLESVVPRAASQQPGLQAKGHKES
ncbi:MAG: AzlC family ABC transporter permease [Deinococcus sp.]|nr:AzlC family ABC transporter permease [Deinococcus sp.]